MDIKSFYQKFRCYVFKNSNTENMKYYFLCLLTILAFAGCKKNDQPITYIPQNLKDLYLFREGTYWTMRDSLTGRIDSFYVSHFDSTFNSYNGRTFEENFTNIHEVNINNINPADSAFYGYNLRGSELNFVYKDYMFNEDIHYSGGWQSATLLPEFISSGKSYVSIFKYREIADLYVDYNAAGYSDDDYYYNSKDGFVKIRMKTKYHHFVWELINAHVVR